MDPEGMEMRLEVLPQGAGDSCRGSEIRGEGLREFKRFRMEPESRRPQGEARISV